MSTAQALAEAGEDKPGRGRGRGKPKPDEGQAGEAEAQEAKPEEAEPKVPTFSVNVSAAASGRLGGTPPAGIHKLEAAQLTELADKTLEALDAEGVTPADRRVLTTLLARINEHDVEGPLAERVQSAARAPGQRTCWWCRQRIPEAEVHKVQVSDGKAGPRHGYVCIDKAACAKRGGGNGRGSNPEDRIRGLVGRLQKKEIPDEEIKAALTSVLESLSS